MALAPLPEVTVQAGVVVPVVLIKSANPLELVGLNFPSV